jgi:hypothetical protein
MSGLVDNPLAMAGLSVMSGKNLGDALSEAAQLKQQGDYRAMQMQLWQAQAAQAMQQANLNQQLLADPSFGMGQPTGQQPMPQTVMPNQMPQQGGGQVPPVIPVQESDIPPMPNYLNTPEAQNLRRRMMIGSAAGNAGVVDAAKLELDNLKELAKQSYEANYGPQIAGAKKEAETAAELRAKMNDPNITKGKERLDLILNDISSQYDLLKNGGGVVSEEGSTTGNIGAYFANTGIGQEFGKAIGSKEQTIRNNIASKRPLISQAIMQATGMSSKQLDSNVELQNFLKSVGDPTASYESVKKTFADLSKNFGLGTVQGLPEKQSKANQIMKNAGKPAGGWKIEAVE